MIFVLRGRREIVLFRKFIPKEENKKRNENEFPNRRIQCGIYHLGSRIICEYPNQADMGNDGEVAISMVPRKNSSGKLGKGFSKWTSTLPIYRSGRIEDVCRLRCYRDSRWYHPIPCTIGNWLGNAKIDYYQFQEKDNDIQESWHKGHCPIRSPWRIMTCWTIKRQSHGRMGLCI